VLREMVRPRMTARQIMTSPVHALDESVSVREAIDLLNRYSIDSAPVHSGGKLTGMVRRKTLDQALGHGLGDQPVASVSTREVPHVLENAPFQEVERCMSDREVRLLPVVRDREVVGVITRSNLLQVFQARARHGGHPEFSDGVEIRRNLRMLVEERLRPETKELLHQVGAVADERGVSAYLVGGMVRDLLLGQSSEDVDVVVEGDGIRLAGILARKWGGRIKAHRKFGTATVIVRDTPLLDVASARTEHYSTPGALPSVEWSSLRRDLYRRDFTVNALALKLNADGFGQLVDFFGGERDIRDRRIRVLHGLSFVEDGTRAFRAVRFEQRFSFRIDEQTLHFLRTAISTGALVQISPRRLLHEMDLTLSERDPYRVLQRLATLGILREIHPALVIGPKQARTFRACGEAMTWHRLQVPDVAVDRLLIAWMALGWGMKDELDELLARLELPKRRARALGEGRAEVRRLLHRMGRRRDTDQGGLLLELAQASEEVLIFALGVTRSEETRRLLVDTMTRSRGIEPELDGDDVLALGVPRGPQVGRALAELRKAVLQGTVRGRNQEIEFVTSWLRSLRS